MIDVTNCLLCRKGIYPFIKDNDKFKHVDIIATPEAAAIYTCNNSETIGEYLINDEKRGVFMPNEELKKLLSWQSEWWECIIALAHDLLKDSEKVQDFFNEGTKGDRMYMRPNLVIETALLELAKDQNIEVTEDEYYGLIKYTPEP